MNRMAIFKKKISGGAYYREGRHVAYRRDLFKALGMEAHPEPLKESMVKLAVSWLYPENPDDYWNWHEYWEEDILMAMKVIVGITNLQGMNPGKDADAMAALVLAQIGTMTRTFLRYETRS